MSGSQLQAPERADSPQNSHMYTCKSMHACIQMRAQMQVVFCSCRHPSPSPPTVSSENREESAELEDRRLDFLVTSCNNARKGCSLLKVIHLGSFRFDYTEASLYTSKSKQLFFNICVCKNPETIFSLFTTPHLNCGTMNYLSSVFFFATNKMTPKETKRFSL